MENRDNPNSCVCGDWKRERESFCGNCLKRIAEIRERKLQQRVEQIKFRAVDDASDRPRILERMSTLPDITTRKPYPAKYNGNGDDNAFDDIVRLYEDSQ